MGRVQVEAQIPKIAVQHMPMEGTFVQPSVDNFCPGESTNFGRVKHCRCMEKCPSEHTFTIFLAARNDDLNSSKPKAFNMAGMAPFSLGSGLAQALTTFRCYKNESLKYRRRVGSRFVHRNLRDKPDKVVVVLWYKRYRVCFQCVWSRV